MEYFNLNRIKILISGSLKKVAWFFWKKPLLTYLFLYLLLLVGILWNYENLDIESFNIILFISYLFEHLNSLTKENIFFNILLTLTIPAVIALFISWNFKYYLIPGNKTNLLLALTKTCFEVRELANKRIENATNEIQGWIEGLPSGCETDENELNTLSTQILEITKAKTLYATCLQTPERLHDDLKAYTEIIANELNIRDKKLVRILKCDKEKFNLNDHDNISREKIKWFVNLHLKQPNLELRFINEKYLLIAASSNNIALNQLDVMLFDNKLIWTLKTDINTLEVSKENGNYTLYLSHSHRNLSSFNNFFKTLIDHSVLVDEYIQNNNLKEQYVE